MIRFNCRISIFVVVFLFRIIGERTAAQSTIPKGVNIALPYPVFSLDTLTSTASDAAAENIRSLIFNSLVKKSDTLENVSDLAEDIKISSDGKSVTFLLRSGVRFHNGQKLTTADVKYTFDELFKSNGYKSGAFYSFQNSIRVQQVSSIRIADPRTITFDLAQASYREQVLSSITSIPIVPVGSVETQKDHPVGTGPFKFVSRSEVSIDLSANLEYWGRPAKIQSVKLIAPHTTELLWSGLLRGEVDLGFVPVASQWQSFEEIIANPKLIIHRSNGSNIQYLGFNTKSRILKNVKLRKAIAYAIDRPNIIKEVLHNNARIADSILPPESWAFHTGTEYNFDLKRAKELIRRAGYRKEKIILKLATGNEALVRSAKVVQTNLVSAGLKVDIEIVEANVVRMRLMQGKFDMYLGTWIGGNQDPLFLLDLFTTGKIPSSTQTCCNRSRYSNYIVDALLNSARDTSDRTVAKRLYAKAWQIISDDMPLLPLWHPSTVVIARNNLKNIKIGPNGEWTFIRDIEIAD